MNGIERLARRLDRAQQRHTWTSFPLAVVKKFGDDRASDLAALLAYYAFFSLFPLLLALVTILGLVLRNNPSLQQRILDSALSQFPIIGDQLAVQGLSGSAVALVVGLVGAVWSGLAVLNTSQSAMNAVWDVPRVRQPSFVKRVVRGLVVLAVAGSVVLVSAGLAGLGSSGGALSLPLKALAFAGSLVLNVVLFASAFRFLTVAGVSWRDVLPGAMVAALVWVVLSFVGTWFVDRQIRNASQVYGFFAMVIGLLSWLYLGAQMTLLAAEVNVVRARRLWPRTLLPPPAGEPDKRSLAKQAEEQAALPEEEVDVRFGPPSSTGV